MDIFSGFELDSLFPIVIKYSMESMEKAIIRNIEALEGTHDAASLIMIAQMLNSDQLYEKAKDRLIQHTEHLHPEDADRIGGKAVYEVMLGRYNNKVKITRQPEIPQCPSCNANVSFQVKCNNCDKSQRILAS
jgi:hypothetical protein